MTAEVNIRGRAKDLILKNFFGRTNTVTMGGNLTLTVDSPMLQFLDPTTARDVILPEEAVSNGLVYIIVNMANGSEVITVKDDGSSTIATPTQNEMCIVACNGVNWRGMVGSA